MSVAESKTIASPVGDTMGHLNFNTQSGLTIDAVGTLRDENLTIVTIHSPQTEIFDGNTQLLRMLVAAGVDTATVGGIEERRGREQDLDRLLGQWKTWAPREYDRKVAALVALEEHRIAFPDQDVELQQVGLQVGLSSQAMSRLYQQARKRNIPLPSYVRDSVVTEKVRGEHKPGLSAQAIAEKIGSTENRVQSVRGRLRRNGEIKIAISGAPISPERRLQYQLMDKVLSSDDAKGKKLVDIATELGLPIKTFYNMLASLRKWEAEGSLQEKIYE